MARHRRTSFLNRLSSVLGVVLGLALPSGAFAGDFAVSYAFDGTTGQDVAAAVISALNEQGTKKDCRYDTLCEIELSKSDLSITFDLRRDRDRKDISVYVNGRGSRSFNCCTFGGGDQTFSRNFWEPLVRVPIYEGHRRRGNEYVQNLYLGVLYLQFSDLK